MAIKKEIQINVNTSSAQKNVDDLNSSINETNGAVGGLTGTLDKMTGGLVSGFKNGVKGIKQGITAMKSLKVAIASTGIGALIILLGSVITYFSKTQRGADLLSRAMKGVGAFVDVLTDRFSAFGELVVGVFKNPQQALKDFGNLIKQNIQNRIEGMLELIPAMGKAISLALKGQFVEAGKTAVNAMGKVTLGVESVTDATQKLIEGTKGIINEINEETRAAIKLEKAQQALEDREISMIKTRATTRRDVEAARLIAADQSKTTQERADALQRAIDLEKKLSEEEIAIAKERARIITEQNALGESSRDDLRAQAEAEAKIIELEAQRDAKLKELVGTMSGLNAQLAKNTEVVDENLQKQLEADEKLYQELEDKYNSILDAQLKAQDQELNAVEDKYRDLLANAEKFGFDEAEIARMKNEEINKINKKYYDQDAKNKQDAEIAKLQIVSGALNGLSQLVGEQTQAGKAISAAQAIIDTYTGATKALAQGGIFGTIAAAGVVASGIASVRSIYATEVPAPKQSSVSVGGRSIGGGGGSYSRPTSNIPRPQLSSSIGINTSGANLANQITESLSGKPMRAYVVNQDIESTQKLNRKIEETATFG